MMGPDLVAIPHPPPLVFKASWYAPRIRDYIWVLKENYHNQRPEQLFSRANQPWLDRFAYNGNLFYFYLVVSNYFVLSTIYEIKFTSQNIYINWIPLLHCLQPALQGTGLLWLLILYFLEECPVETDCDQMAKK